MLRVYPGSPSSPSACCVATRQAQSCLSCNPHDLARAAGLNVAKLRQTPRRCCNEDGFEGIKKFCLHRPVAHWCYTRSRLWKSRATGQIARHGGNSLKRFATGTYAFWYPIIPRPRSPRPALPPEDTGHHRRARANLHATLTVKSSKITETVTGDANAPACLPAACS